MSELNLSDVAQSLHQRDQEKEIHSQLLERTELLKKQIACLKLYEQVREASLEERENDRYSALLSQIDGEMKELALKRGVSPNIS
jgi:hypothetical protein